jgi:hypothetical protein
MASALRWTLVGVALAATLASAQTTSYRSKTETTPPPKELDPAIGKLLAAESVQLLDPKGEAVAEVWLRKEIPVQATPEQIKNGLTYREIAPTTILGAVRFDRRWSDYRKQPIKPGVYTLRFALQPESGDHQGTAPYPEFCVLVAAERDTNADVIALEKLNKISSDSIGTTHAAVFLLFPNNKPVAAPQVVAKDAKHVVLNMKGSLTADGKPAGSLGIGLTLIGHSE